MVSTTATGHGVLGRTPWGVHMLNATDPETGILITSHGNKRRDSTWCWKQRARAGAVPVLCAFLTAVLLGRIENHARLQFMLASANGDSVYDSSFTHETLEQIGLIVSLRRGDRVVQLGGNIGTSCILAARMLRTSAADDRRVMCVEPNPRFWPDLERNRQLSGSSFQIVRGYLLARGQQCPKTPRLVTNCTRYGDCQPVGADEHHQLNDVIALKCHEWEQTMAMGGFREPDVFFADCEGCMDEHFTSPHHLRGLRAVVYEDDSSPEAMVGYRGHGIWSRAGEDHKSDVWKPRWEWAEEELRAADFTSMDTSLSGNEAGLRTSHSKPHGWVRVWFGADVASWRVHWAAIHYVLDLFFLPVGGLVWFTACCVAWCGCVHLAAATMADAAHADHTRQWAVACACLLLGTGLCLWGVPVPAHFWTAPLLLALGTRPHILTVELRVSLEQWLGGAQATRQANYETAYSYGAVRGWRGADPWRLTVATAGVTIGGWVLLRFLGMLLVDSFWRPPSYTVNYAVQFFLPRYSVDLAMALLLGAVTVGAMAWSFVRVAPRSAI